MSRCRIMNAGKKPSYLTRKKKKGDNVSAGEVLAEIETDKATMEWESPEDGTLTEIYVEEGGKVEVGEKIAFIGGEGEEAPKKEEKPKEEKKAAPKEEEKAQAETEKPASAGKKEKDTAPPQEKKKEKQAETEKKAPSAAAKIDKEEARVKASPVARRIAAELGVDLASVKGTGPDDR